MLRGVRAAAAGLMVSLLMLLGTSALPVAATTFHQYSHAWENSGTYTGQSNTRLDKATTAGPYGAGCGGPYQGAPVYQTMWAHRPGGSNFELGTGHQCHETMVYWYWGMTDASGNWTSFGYQSGVSNGNTHTFQVALNHPGAGYKIYYTIDGTLKYSLSTSNTNFNDLDQGLESWCATCTMPHYVNEILQVQRYGAAHGLIGRAGTATRSTTRQCVAAGCRTSTGRLARKAPEVLQMSTHLPKRTRAIAALSAAVFVVIALHSPRRFLPSLTQRTRPKSATTRGRGMRPSLDPLLRSVAPKLMTCP